MKKLNLDNCRSAQISGLTDDFKSLLSLSLANVGLTSLKGFPNLPNLRKVFRGGRNSHLHLVHFLQFTCFMIVFSTGIVSTENSSLFVMLFTVLVFV